MTDRAWKSGLWLVLSAIPTCQIVGCGGSLTNLTESLGGVVAGQRGTVSILFINNTPHRAVMTFGTFDQTDQATRPDFRQFSLDDNDVVLDGNETSSFFDLTCSRVFAIGNGRLLERIQAEEETRPVIEDSLVSGVEFFQIDAPDSESKSVGSASAFEVFLGNDFPCNSLLILRLEPNDLGPDSFRVDFEVIASESTR